jgi:hypothetical protein
VKLVLKLESNLYLSVNISQDEKFASYFFSHKPFIAPACIILPNEKGK